MVILTYIFETEEAAVAFIEDGPDDGWLGDPMLYDLQDFEVPSGQALN